MVEMGAAMRDYIVIRSLRSSLPLNFVTFFHCPKKVDKGIWRE